MMQTTIFRPPYGSKTSELTSSSTNMSLRFKIADIVDAHGVELADVVAAHEMKMDAMRIKLKKGATPGAREARFHRQGSRKVEES